MRSDDLERIVPDLVRHNEATADESLRLHLERYEFAKLHLLPGAVLDLACGSGYGTAILAQAEGINTAIGVDISELAIAYAKKRYGSHQVTFACSSATEFRPGTLFETVVSLETIEHVPDPQAVLRHLVSLLAPNGRLIVSAPITPSVDANPHHVTNFSEQTLVRLGRESSLIELDRLYQVQPYKLLAVLKRSEERMHSLRRNLPVFYLSHPQHLALRIASTLRYGLVNRYLTVAWKKN
jgi:SAM-dependent methyltransferase